MEIDKQACLAIVRRVGGPDLVEEADRILPERIDLDRDSGLLRRFGLTEEQMMDRLGGSP